MRKAAAWTVAACGLLALLAAPAAAQCVMCKTALTGSAEGRAMTAHFNHGILLMVFAPYFVMAGFVVVVFREQLVRRAVRFGATVRTRLEAVPARFARLRDPA